MNEENTVIAMRNGAYSLCIRDRKIPNKKVLASMEKIMPGLNKQESVMIITGSSLRDTITGEKIEHILQGAGFVIDKNIIYPQFDEAGEFTWDILRALVKGGEMKFEGFKFPINKLKTNPQGLTECEYFIRGCVNEIPEEEKINWLKSFRYKVEGMETYPSVQNRFARALESLPRNTQIILVTHYWLLFGSVLAITGNKRGLEPAGFIEFRAKKDRLVIKRVSDLNGDMASRNGSADIIKVLKNTYKTKWGNDIEK